MGLVMWHGGVKYGIEKMELHYLNHGFPGIAPPITQWALREFPLD